MKKYDALYIFVGIAKDDALNACLEKALAEVPILTGADVPRLGFTGIFTKLARSLVGF